MSDATEFKGLGDLEDGPDIKDGGDRAGSGFKTIDSQIVDGIIKMAYLDYSKEGAQSVNVTVETTDGNTLRDSLWVRSKASKGGKNYYLNKKKEKVFLMGYNVANHMCLLTNSGPLKKQAVKVRTLKLYDFDAGSEVPRDVEVLEALLEKPIRLGILNELSQYNGKDRNKNIIDKVFRHKDKLTYLEIKAAGKNPVEPPEPAFYAKWEKEYNGTVKDVRTKEQKAGAANGGTAGLPGDTVPDSGDDGLFEDQV